MKIDTTQPHIGRIYDYALGGHHNYEVDRKAAEEVLQFMPSYKKWARLNRWFLQFVGQTWAEEGRSAVLDLASGLPTQGHFNEYLPEARILFSDIDPVSVTYGRQILEGRPTATYVQTDIRKPEGLLDEARTFFGAERKLAVGAVGILYFLADAEVSALLRALHAFCAPGSVLAYSFAHIEEGPDAEAKRDKLRRISEVARISIYPRTPEQMIDLIKPWKVRAQKPADEWLDVPEMLEESDRDLELIGVLADH